MKAHSDKKKEIWEQLHEIRKVVDEKGAEIDKFKGEMDAQREGQNELRELLDRISEKVEEKSDELNALYKEKDEIKETFWENMFKSRE